MKVRFFCMFICTTFSILSATPKVLIGVAGGTGSGKTTIASKIQQAFPSQSILISQDSYYKELSQHSVEQRAHFNFDHPDALDFELLKEHLLAIKNDTSIKMPVYNFHSHSRESYTISVDPSPIVIVEGILLFAVPEIRDLFDLRIFVDTDDDIRILRRVERDMQERSRDFASVKTQYLTTVKPMHEAFVAPSKKYADLIIPEGGHNQIALNVIFAKINEDLN